MITQKELKRLLNYNPKTGIFRWRIGKSGIAAWSIAGSLHARGYIGIQIHNTIYQAHRLVFLYVRGTIPIEVDHKDHIRCNNRWDNLREVTRLENMKNKSKSIINKSGVTGVYWHKLASKWAANIRVNKAGIHLGTFKNKNDAIKARKEAEIKYGFHKNHGS